jgi:uroporphyrin-III C-methyltransferase
LAAQSNATIVILMGMTKLAEIITIYLKNNRHNTPIAIIQNGTKKEEKYGIGVISTIESIVKKKQLSSPAIIIIGDVVNGHESLITYFSEAFLEDDFIYQNLDIHQTEA